LTEGSRNVVAIILVNDISAAAYMGYR